MDSNTHGFESTIKLYGCRIKNFIANKIQSCSTEKNKNKIKIQPNFRFFNIKFIKFNLGRWKQEKKSLLDSVKADRAEVSEHHVKPNAICFTK